LNKKDSPLSILKSLVEKSDLNYVLPKKKREAKRRYKKFRIFPSSSFFLSKKKKIGKKIPSTFFLKKYADKKQNNSLILSKHVQSFLQKNVQYINLLLNNIYVHFFIIRKKRLKKNNKVKKQSINDVVFSFIFSVYLLFLWTLVLKVKFPKKLKHFNLKSLKV
jgi:hypothetical protein